MKATKIHELTTEELVDKIQEEQLNYTKMKLTHSITPLESSAKITATRKLIARLKTILRQREINK